MPRNATDLVDLSDKRHADTAQPWVTRNVVSNEEGEENRIPTGHASPNTEVAKRPGLWKRSKLSRQTLRILIRPYRLPVSKASRLLACPDEVLLNILHHVVVSDRPIIDPRPPHITRIRHQWECAAGEGYHKSSNPKSKYSKELHKDRAMTELNDLLTNEHQSSKNRTAILSKVHTEVLRSCKRLESVGKEVLHKHNTVAFSTHHAFVCFIDWYTEATKRVEELAVVAAVHWIPARNLASPCALRVVSQPRVFSSRLLPFRRLKLLTIHVHGGAEGLPGNRHVTQRGLLRGVDLAHWLATSGWQLDNVKLSGLDSIGDSDTMLLPQLEEIVLTERSKAKSRAM